MNRLEIYGIIYLNLVIFPISANAQEAYKTATSKTSCDDSEKNWKVESCKTMSILIGLSQARCYLDHLKLEKALLQKELKGQMPDGDMNEAQLEMSLITANLINRGGDALIANKCPTDARKLFMSVIDTYSGTAYEAVRQHAMVGIEDARALSLK